MSKKILGLVVSVALLMVVLSGCFLLPQIDTHMPVVVINSPTYGQVFTVPTQQSTTSVTANITVYASSGIQSVPVSIVQNGQTLTTVNANGPYGQNTGNFTWTFKNLSVGTYTLTAQAYSQCKTPSNLMSTKFTITSTQVVTPPSTKYKAPGVSLINVAPNYQGKYYVAKSPITFSATVTNPNSVGQLAVWASVNGQTIQPNNSSNPYTFTWTPSATGTYTLYVNATVTIGASTVSGSNSVVVKVPYINPSANVAGIPSRLVMASTTPASFTFTTTSGVNAYLSINNGAAATYTSQSPIANSKLTPNVWNTLTLTFKDPWGYTIQTAVATVLGVQASNPANTPYVFLIDKAGHVVNTNDWITIPAGSNLDLYGYIEAGSQPITSYNLTQQYFTSKMLTTSIAGPGTVLSGSYPTPQNIVPVKLLAYLFDPQVAPNNAYVTFQINVNNTSIAFLRYDVTPVTAAPVVTLNSNGTYEGVPAQVTVTVNSLQPITGIKLGVPVKVNSPFTGYSTTTAYSNAQNGTNSMAFTYSLIEPVSAVQTYGANAYGFVYGSQNYNVAFYGPSGIYTIGATVTGIASMTTYATTNYAVQADTSAPTVKVTYAGSSVSISGINMPVYYGPMTVKATVNDDHAIYWAMMTSPATAFLVYPNNTNIANYGQRATTITAKVSFTQPGTYNAYIVASDKHFDPTTFTLNQTVLGTGNTVMTPNYPILYSNAAPQATPIGGQYTQSVNNEQISFAVSAKDTIGGYNLLSPTAIVKLIPMKNPSATTTTIVATFGSTMPQQPSNYSATISTYGLVNQTQYNVVIGVKDLIYDALQAAGASQSILNQHITWINWGVITVDLVYPNVALSAGTTYSPLSATPTTVNTTVFRVDINNDPFFPWGQFAENNYNQLLNYINVQVGNTTNGFNTAAYVIPLNVTQTSTQSGYFLFAIPGLYQNVGLTNQVATQTIQVSVYNSIQPSKAIFGQVVRTVVPAQPFTVSISGAGATNTANGMAATPVINTTGTYTLPVTISGLVGSQSGMTLTFMVNGTPTSVVPAVNKTYYIPVPTPAGTTLTSIRVLYAPNYYQVPGAARVSVQSFNIPQTYQYFRYFSTLYTLGDNITPSASLTLNGVNINNSSTIIKAPFNYTYSINGVLYYLHDLAVTTKFATGHNTTINGVVKFSSYSASTTTLASPTLKATSLLLTFGATQSSKWTISKPSKTFSMPGVYNISFTGYDPNLNVQTTVSATVAVDPYVPVISGVKLNGNSVANVTSGIVPTIANGNKISAVATDYAGVKSASINITDLIDNAATTYPMTNHFGIGTFSATVQATVALPQVFSPQYQNLPYEVTFYATNVAGMGATHVTRLFVTNVDHSPYIKNITVNGANQLLVTLTEPMWVNGFKAFGAYLNGYGQITSNAISPAIVLATYQNAQIAAQFVVTFTSNYWSNVAGGTSIVSNLTNIQASSSLSSYVPIVDLAGNQYGMPVYTTTKPVVTVTPASTTIGGSVRTITLTVSATSPVGISQISGAFPGNITQFAYNTSKATFIFNVPTTSSTKTYTAIFTVADNNPGTPNTTVATAYVNVNPIAPKINSISASKPVIANGATSVITVKATVGSINPENNTIKSVTINTLPATFAGMNSSGYATYKATVTFTGSGSQTVNVKVTDIYGNSAASSTLKIVYVDASAPTITVKIGTTVATSVNFVNGQTYYFKTAPKATATVLGYKLDNFATYTYNIASPKSTSLTFSKTSGGSSTTFEATYSGYKYSITVKATDGISKLVNSITTSATVVFGTNKPTAVAMLTRNSTAILVAPEHYYINASTTKYTATYTFASNNSGMPLKSAEILLYNSSTKSTQVIYSNTSVNSNKATGTINLVSYVGTTNGATFTLTTIATDMAGNTTSQATSFYVDVVKPSITSIYRATTSGSPIYITFSSTMAASAHPTTFTATFLNASNGLQYVGDFTFTSGATAASTQQFTIVGGVGTVLSSNLPSASYKVTLPSTVTDLALNQLSNNNSSWQLP